MKKKTSIHDIARHLQVSPTTVSFVLNGKAGEKRISEELTEKVLKYVEEIGYHPNMIAQSLRTGKSNIICMLVEDISDPFFASIARIVEINAYKQGYKIFYASTENDTEKTKELIRIFRDRQVDGYIIAPPPGVEEDISSLLEDNLPVVLFDRYFPGLNTVNVVIDNKGGTFKATQYLHQNGYRNTALVTLESEQTQMLDRLKGYEQAIKENGQKKKFILKIPYLQKNENTVEEVRGFLEKNKNIDAVLFATNYLAVSGLEAIVEMGLRIPEDIAVISFDDNPLFNLFSPNITAVAQPMRKISEEVVQQLMKHISANGKKAQKKETVVLPVELIIRKSATPKIKESIKT